MKIQKMISITALSILLMLSFIQHTSSQVYRQWTQTLNGSINNEDYFVDAAVDDSGNVYITGTVYNSPSGRDIIIRKYYPDGSLAWQNDYSSSIPDGQDGGANILYKNNFVYISGSSESAAGGIDIIVIKRNAVNGNLIWSKTFNGTANGNDHPSSMTIDNADNVYVSGMSHNGSNDFDMVILKYNSSGGFQWKYTGGGAGFDRCDDIKTDNSGNVYACGTDVISPVFSEMVTLKFQPDGTQMMHKVVENGVDSNDGASCLEIDAQGNVYTAGYVGTLNQGSNTALVKYNSSGVQQWVRYYNGSSNEDDAAWDMALDAAGNIYLTGYSYSTVTKADYLTLKYNSSGTNLWSVKYIGNYLGDNIALSIAVDAGGNSYITGRSQESASGSDIATVKYNSSGSMQWVMKENGSVNASNLEIGYSLVLDDLNNVFVAGKNDVPDAALIKYVQAPIGIQPAGNEIPAGFELKQNYPNPFNPNTTIEFSIPSSSFVTIGVYDMPGKKVYDLVNEQLSAGNYRFTFDASGLSSGTYFCMMRAGEFTGIKKMILVK